MGRRLKYRKRHSYSTKSSQKRVVKTPGGKLVYQTLKKRASGLQFLGRGSKAIVRAFQFEEQKIVKKVLKLHKAKKG